MKKINIWWFEDDDVIVRQTKELEFNKMKDKVNLKRFKCVFKEINRVGSPDIIFLDIASITNLGSIVMFGARDCLWYNLRGFVEKHTSPIYILYSMVGAWAEEFAEELKDYFKEDIVIEYRTEYKEALNLVIKYVKELQKNEKR